MCIFKRGQTTHIHNLCISPHFEKWRLYWSLSPSSSHWPSLCQTSTGICILLSWICQKLWNPIPFEQRNLWTCLFWQILEHWILWMALCQRIHPTPSWTILFCLPQQARPMVTPSFFVNDMLYVGSNDAIEKEFKDSVHNCFDVRFLGPAKWFLQMRIHQHKDKSYTLNQHRYVLNTLQCYDPNSEFP